MPPPLYWQYAPAVGLDPAVAWAQLMLETGRIDPRARVGFLVVHAGQMEFCRDWRNGTTALARPNTGVWQQDGAIWREGLAFSSATQGVMAHIGRLIAYAVPPTQYAPAQAWAVGIALDWRPLPARYHGAAGAIEQFGNGVWAKDTRYADKVASTPSRTDGMTTGKDTTMTVRAKFKVQRIEQTTGVKIVGRNDQAVTSTSRASCARSCFRRSMQTAIQNTKIRSFGRPARAVRLSLAPSTQPHGKHLS